MEAKKTKHIASLIAEEFNKRKIVYVGSTAFCGFFSDFYGPVAPFAKYLFCVFVFIFLIIILIYLFSGTMNDLLKSTVVFSILVCTVTGSFWGLQTITRSNNGVISEFVPAIENLQVSLGILDKRTQAIKEDTAKIKQDTGALKEAARDISEKIDTLEQSVGKQGGLIADPKTQEEWYSNARVFELRGDFGNARRAYAKYFSFDRQYLDTHQRYQTFLKVQEGLSGAREIYNEMFDGNSNPIIEYAKLLLNEPETKRERITEFLSLNSDFAPGYYELSRLYSKKTLGDQSLNDKKKEWRCLREFIDLADKGGIDKYFIDQSEVSRMLDEAKSRLATYKPKDLAMFKNPIIVEPISTNSGWMFNLYVPDTVLEYFYKLEDSSEFVGLGKRDLIDPTTNRVYANNTLSVPGMNREQRIEFKYRDVNNTVNGPYEYLFKPAMEMKTYQEKLIKQFVNHWVMIKESTIYFSSLIMRRCGLQEVKYGIDRPNPDIIFKLPTCNPGEPQVLPEDAKIFESIPGNTQFVTIQLKYASGEISPIEKFTVPWGN